MIATPNSAGGALWRELPRPETREAAQRHVSAVCEYIQQHYAENLTNEDLAKLIGVSPSYMTRAFRRVKHVSPQAYVRRVRLVAAMRLTRAGRSQREVAALTGFSHKSHLSRSFRRTFGMPLGAYIRAKNGNGGQPDEADAVATE